MLYIKYRLCLHEIWSINREFSLIEVHMALLKIALTALVYSYTRFSDPRQATGDSLKRQLELATEWANARGLVLDSSLRMHDEGLSAFSGKHVKTGALGIFLAAVEAGKIPRGSFLVVEQFDRLSRQTPIEALAQFCALIAAGITIVTTKDKKEFNAESLKEGPFSLFEAILPMITANEESDKKSIRVIASIRSQCEAWVAGTSRKLIRNGNDPFWLKRVDNKWELIPDRVDGIRTAISLYVQGFGPKAIVKKLQENNQTITGAKLRYMQVNRVIKHEQLIGEKDLKVDGKTYKLLDYYPPILTVEEFAELKSLVRSDVRQIGKQLLVGVLTGIKIAKCGYCGSAMIGTNFASKAKNKEDLLRDGSRRITCSGINHNLCPVKGSASVAPFEKALMHFCSDMINLRSLYGADRSAIPLEKLNKAKAEQAKLKIKKGKVAEALTLGGEIEMIVQLARDLEAEEKKLAFVVETAERELSTASRSEIKGTDKIWKGLVEGVVNQDDEARTKARKLVSDTFENILFYVKGVRPRKTGANTLEMTLIAKGGEPRYLRVTDKGEWSDGESATHKDTPPPKRKKLTPA